MSTIHPGVPHAYCLPLVAGAFIPEGATLPDTLNVCIGCATYHSPELEDHCHNNWTGTDVSEFVLPHGTGHTLHLLYRYLDDGELRSEQENFNHMTDQAKGHEISELLNLHITAVDLFMPQLQHDIVDTFARICRYTREAPMYDHRTLYVLYACTQPNDTMRKLMIMLFAHFGYHTNLPVTYGIPDEFDVDVKICRDQTDVEVCSEEIFHQWLRLNCYMN